MSKVNLPTEWNFHSPTQGSATFRDLTEDILGEARRDAAQPLRICVGSDSEETAEGVKFVAVVLLWRVGRGARAYYYTEINDTMQLRERKGSARFRERIWYEVMLTAALATELRTALYEEFAGFVPESVEVHADVGESGGSSVMLREVMGILHGYGFSQEQIFVKPDAVAASSVADRVI